MTYEQVAGLNIAGAAGYSGISVPGDSIFDDIFDWVANVIPSIIQSVGQQIVNIINAIGSNVVIVFNALSSGFINVITTLGSVANQIVTDVFIGINSIITTLGSVANQIVASVFTGINSIITTIGSVANQIVTGVSLMIAGVSQTIVTTFGQISTQVQANFSWITNWLATSIPKILGDWWDLFIGKIFDFGSWIGPLFDAISAWVTRDIPGHSPWWTGVTEAIGTFLRDTVWNAVKQVLPQTLGPGYPALVFTFKIVTDIFAAVLDDMMGGIINYVSSIGEIKPDMALTHVISIGKVAMIALTGLITLTLTGELVGFWKHVGLGPISAIFFDMSNYKLITAGLMGAIVGASIKTPLTYYFNYKLRPNIPSIRELQDMYTDESITDAEFGQYMGYHGIADGWHGKYKDIAYRAMSPYQLKVAATDGAFDEGIFSRELTHAGFRPEIKQMLMDSFRKASLVNLKVTAVTSATYRFKKGYTDEDQFINELKILQVGDAMIPAYLAATRLDYASDYLTDLTTAYQDAVRSGQIGVDDYRQGLLNLGMVPERVEGKIFIEQARIKPSAALSPVAGSKSYYLTDAGKIIVDTNRRQRRASLITRDQELAAFSSIGMPVDLATAYADNDDVRLKAPATAAGG